MPCPRRAANPTTAALIAAALALALPAGAAAHERTWHVGGSLGFAQLFGGPSAAGFGAGAHVAYGLNDMFNVMGALHVTAHPYARWVIVGGGVGAGWLVDTFEWVPYVGGLAGLAEIISVNPLCGASIAEPCQAMRVNLEVPFGLDYRFTRRFTAGVAGRLQLLLLGDVPWLTLGVFARAEVTFGK